MKKSYILFVLAVAACAVFTSCNIRQVEEPIQTSSASGAENSSLYNSAGLVKTVFSPYETVFLSLDGLWSAWETTLEVVRLGDKKIIRRLVVITDIDGKLSNIPVWYNIGVGTNGYTAIAGGDYMIHIQQAHPTNPWFIASIPFSVRNTQSGSPTVWAAKSDGSFAHATALAGSKVYVQGANFTPGVQVRLCVVPDKETYAAGEPLLDQTDAIEQVTTANDGSLPSTLVWANALVGNYDIVADVAPFGVYGSGDAVSDGQLAGLVVQSNSSATDIIADIACDAGGFHSNAFSCDDAIYGQVNPAQRPKNASELAAVYVVFHKDQWKAGDRLIDVETVDATEMPINCLVSPWSGSLSRILLRGTSKDENGQPVRLWPGKYDVIVDIGRNGQYDPGTDILDGGSQIGFTITCDATGAAAKLIVGADCDFLDQNASQTYIHALLIDQNGNPIPGVNVSFKTTQGRCGIAASSRTTNANGLVTANLYNIYGWGNLLVIKVEAVVNGVTLVEYCTIWKVVPFVHNTGTIISQ